MSEHKLQKQTKQTDRLVIFLALLGSVVGFINIYRFAGSSQQTDAVFAGILVFALSFVLATRLAKMRRI